MHAVSVVIPVFKSASSLPEWVKRLKAILNSISYEFEIVIVEDGGQDDSLAVMEDLRYEDHRTRGIHLSRNCGQHNDLSCGIRAARYDSVVTAYGELVTTDDGK
jgi:undecaprenyl-phosphate 4-deoxy-4-formamido-L-arabinose transferase